MGTRDGNLDVLAVGRLLENKTSVSPPFLPYISDYDKMKLKGGKNMQEIRLTNEAELLLCVLYNAYTSRRKDGMVRTAAKNFGSSQRIQEEWLPQMPLEDIDDAARELKRKGLFTFIGADDTVYADAKLTEEGIIYMEHETGDKLDQFLERIATLRKIIFG